MGLKTKKGFSVLVRKKGGGLSGRQKEGMPFAAPKILLLGFPNVGKSLLFHHLTGAYVLVSNYPGTTVEVSRGKGQIGGRVVEVIDTPGIYSLQGKTEEEKVTLRVLQREKPQLILLVVEAAALPRVLHLLPELKNYGSPLIVVLNMIDEAEKKGLFFDEKILARELQVPVVATVCTKKIGLVKLKKNIEDLLFSSLKTQDRRQKKEEDSFSGIGDKALRTRQAAPGYFLSRTDWDSRMHFLLINPFVGYPLAFLLLFFCFYLFLGVLGAGKVVYFLEEKIFIARFIPFCRFWLGKYIHSILLRDFLAGEYGLLTMGLRYALTIVLPIISMFFLFFALLEDCGYLPRLAYLLHRPLSYLGLDGRGAIPLVMGFGCGTMAVLVTRLLETPRERFLATFLLSLGIPCSAQIGLLMAILSPYPALLLIWGFTWGAFFTACGWALNRFYPGKRSYICIEFPPLRMPQFTAVLRKTAMRVVWYFKEIVPFFLLISGVFQILTSLGYFASLEHWLSPLFFKLGLPREAVPVFIFGFLRRDYAAAGLYDLRQQGILTPAATLVSTIILTLYFPCIAQFAMILKERGLWESLLILLLLTLVTYTAGYAVYIFISL